MIIFNIFTFVSDRLLGTFGFIFNIWAFIRYTLLAIATRLFVSTRLQPYSCATFRATVMAAILLGCVHAIRPSSEYPASTKYCGICVVFPDPGIERGYKLGDLAQMSIEN